MNDEDKQWSPIRLEYRRYLIGYAMHGGTRPQTFAKWMLDGISREGEADA